MYAESRPPLTVTATGLALRSRLRTEAENSCVERIDVVRPGRESDPVLRIEVEVSVNRERVRRDNQEVRRGKRVDAFEEGACRGICREEQQDEVGQHRLIRGLPSHPAAARIAFAFEANRKCVPDARVTERPDAKSIAGDDEPIQTRIEHADRKISVEVFNERVTESASRRRRPSCTSGQSGRTSG